MFRNNCTPSQMVAAFRSDAIIPLEYVDQFACPDQLRVSDQIAYWKQHEAYQHADPPLNAGRHSLQGQLSSRRSTQLAMVNSARDDQLSFGTRRSLRPETACDLIHLAMQSRVGSFQQQSVLLLADQSITETQPSGLVSELQLEGEEKLSTSPRKRVTFDSNITTYEHYSHYGSTDSLPEGNQDVQTEKERTPISSTQPLLEDDNSVKLCIVSYPPNHRYHNARDSDDEAEEDYSDIDLDDLEDDYEDEDEVDCKLDGQETWPGSTLIISLESRTENQSAGVMKKIQSLEEDGTLGPKSSQARNRSDYVNSVLNPVENVTQWKAAKSKGTCLLKSQKENKESLLALSVRCDLFKNSNQEISVDASLSNWLVSSASTLPKQTSSSAIEYINDIKTIS
ncbi:hypothetical protein F511_31143 [Dorcoceras hygrometricum]|uniref:Uncharacterized protein n=1 Tax=Dorcoceras hygrometricum TaxID=472368 RepID=A0A2Z7BT77_9LAMI|nr:hypothetical protein F511_31143 [Dorcoceras hygrometricum]